MKKQYAVFGLGSFGESIAVTLQRLGCEVVAVDNHMERVQEISDSVSYAMKADIGDPDVIRTMGARNLDGVIVAVADDMEASVMATLVSKEMGVPYEMGIRTAKNLVSANFVDWIALSSEYSIMEIAVPKDWVGKSLQELDVRRSHDVNVVGIKVDEDVEVNPDPLKPLEAGMVLILVGSNDALEQL